MSQFGINFISNRLFSCKTNVLFSIMYYVTIYRIKSSVKEALVLECILPGCLQIYQWRSVRQGRP